MEIPYEGTTLLGYFHPADTSGAPRKTLILNNGFDGSPEEMHWNGARAAVERGFNVLVFDGPGQFASVHRQGLHFRPDWEKVVTPVVDYLLTRKEVDPKKIALHGESFAGYLAPRAAAFEHRLAACIADDGVYDYGAAQFNGVPEDKREQVLAGLFAPEAPELDTMLAHAMEASSVSRWVFTQGMYTFGVDSPRKYIAATQAYHLRDGIAEQIRCPTLVCRAEKDLYFKQSAQELFDHLTCPKTMIEFTDAEGVGAHCEMARAAWPTHACTTGWTRPWPLWSRVQLRTAAKGNDDAPAAEPAVVVEAIATSPRIPISNLVVWRLRENISQ